MLISLVTLSEELRALYHVTTEKNVTRIEEIIKEIIFRGGSIKVKPTKIGDKFHRQFVVQFVEDEIGYLNTWILN